MDRARAAALRDDWAARLPDPPSPEAAEGVERLLRERVPEPEVAAAIVDADGRRLLAALAGGALYLVWAMPGAPEAVRVRRIPLQPAAVEVSERGDERFWWFELAPEPLVFRGADAFAAALAEALGWPSIG